MKKANPIQRFLAFLIDIVPIWLLMLVVYKVTTGESPMPADRWSGMTAGQILVRDGWILVWIPYCIIAEATPMRGNLGKKFMGLQMLNAHGRPLGFGQIIIRNLSKILSAIPCWAGFFFAFISKRSNAWHDSLSGAGVYERR